MPEERTLWSAYFFLRFQLPSKPKASGGLNKTQRNGLAIWGPTPGSKH